MLNDRKYSFIVFSDEGGAPRRWTFSRRTLRAAMWMGAAAVALFGYFALHYTRTYHMPGGIENLEVEFQALEDENTRYVAEIGALRNAQEAIEERIAKLATMVGVETLSDASYVGGAGGVSGAERVFPAQELPPAAARQIVEIESQQSLFGQSLTELEQTYEKKQHLLNFIPSIWPVDGIITGGYGWRRDPFTGRPDFHAAVDISARTNTPVRAPADGIVSSRGYSSGYGNSIVLSHGFGYVTRYGHLHRSVAEQGQRVQRGDVIAYAGSTGRSTAPHLHYEILVNQKPINARNFVLAETRRF
ncbi:MAG: M23 family metallopeptidase [Acidobacteriota bacterium]|nr:MAG: M23 family metallopeptidase [Acidobacteriota bacterium]